MEPGQIEVVNISNLQVPVRRERNSETYLALQPPEASPYMVAPIEMPIEEVVEFIQQRLELLHELRFDMLKHFKKTQSLKCHFRTGDVVYLLGRPFMLRVYPLSSARSSKRGTRTRANVKATVRRDYSVIDLFVAQVGNYDQGRMAFFSFAQPVFAYNIKSLLEQCMGRVLPDVTLPTKVNCRPMRDAWIRINEAQDTVWFSESLIPYPPNAVVYAFLVEALKYYARDASDAERQELVEKGVPNWQDMKTLLADPNNRFAL